MSFFISEAVAEATTTAPAPVPPDLMSLLFPIGLIVLFYFFLIRPQSKRHKEHKEMINGLKKGEEVVTTGGLLGKITAIGDNFISLEIGNNITIHVQKNSVQSVMPKGTIKELG